MDNIKASEVSEVLLAQLRDINIQARRFYYEGAVHGELVTM